MDGQTNRPSRTSNSACENVIWYYPASMRFLGSVDGEKINRYTNMKMLLPM